MDVLEASAEAIAKLAEHDSVEHLVLPGQEGAHGLAALQAGVALATHAQCVAHQLLAEGGLLGDALVDRVVHLKKVNDNKKVKNEKNESCRLSSMGSMSRG